MSGMQPPAGASLWKEAPQPGGGKPYYYNTVTNETTWEKPIELMTLTERALRGTPWQEYYNEEQKRKYWHNPETQQTTWDEPEEVKNNRKAIQDELPQRPPPTGPTTWAAGPANFVQPYNPRQSERDEWHQQRRDPEERTFGGDRNAVAFTPSIEPQYNSHEEAEAAFMKLLKRTGVQSDWTLHDTIKACVRDPQWRALSDAKEREIAFKKYCEDLRTQDKEKEQARQAKLRDEFTAMLKSHPEIKYYTRWKTALPIIESESIFRVAKDYAERRQLFEEYILTLKAENEEKRARERKSAIDDLNNFMHRLDLEPSTRWATFEDKLQNSDKLIHDPKLQALAKTDILTVFESHVKYLREEHNQFTQAEKRGKYRKERKNRDAFKALLIELKHAGSLKYNTMWKDIHPLIKDDPRYDAMLGQSGSTMLDLFWDALAEEEHKFRSLRHQAMNVLEKQRYEVKVDTPYEEFRNVMQTDRQAAAIDDVSMRDIFNWTVDKVKKREEEEHREAEHQENRQMDNFRYVLKELEPPVSIADTWEDILPRVEKLKEYKALNPKSLAEKAFDKHVRRLQQKERDKERDRKRERDRDRDRDRRERERTREYHNGHSESRRHATRTHSPEVNAYDEERKKAQQDREARYKKDDSTGLSPLPRHDRARNRDYDDDRRRDRERLRQGPGDHYGHERREREAQRERVFSSRAGPTDTIVELNYGDSDSLGSRRRRDSEGDSLSSKRESKRARLSSRRRSRTPPQQPTPELPKEDLGLRSGSEEGEIEED